MQYAVRMTIERTDLNANGGKGRTFTQTTIIPAFDKKDALTTVDVLSHKTARYFQNEPDYECHRSYEPVAILYGPAGKMVLSFDAMQHIASEWTQPDDTNWHMAAE